MSNFKNLFRQDMARYKYKPELYIKIFTYLLRRAQTTNHRVLKLIYKVLFRFVASSRGLEITTGTSIGGGLYLGHAYNITINAKAIIGKNCNIHKGCTIGQENRGKREGTPIIGNNVYIGINAVVSGKITIGDDVLIGPNCHVNCDVPSHSVVIGNPCVIKHRENATERYVNYFLEDK